MSIREDDHFLTQDDLQDLIRRAEEQAQKDWQRFLNFGEPLELDDGDVVVEQYETDQRVFVLESGQLEVLVRQSAHGPANKVALVEAPPSKVFGEQTFLDGQPRSATLVAKGPTRVRAFSMDAFDRLRVEEPELACAFLFDVARALSVRFRRTQEGRRTD
jgi:CRP/FNR family cyclic AMP-dependent transcriptional regulator